MSQTALSPKVVSVAFTLLLYPCNEMGNISGFFLLHASIGLGIYIFSYVYRDPSTL